MRRIPVALIAAAFALWAAPVASAQRCVAPPGTAAVEQYCETIPAAGGSRASDSGPKDPVPLSRRTARDLAGSGAEGEQLLRSLGHDPQKRSSGSGRSRPDIEGGDAPSEPSSNPLDAVRSALSGGPSMGSGFFTVLVALTLLMLGFAWFSYRRRPTE